MRSLILLGTVAALLAGCATSESGEAPVGTADAGHGSHASHSGAAPADTQIHPHTHLDSIPAAYHGVYDGSLEACARASDLRLTVSAKELRFHESVGTVRSVGFGGRDAIGVEADYEGEGQRWRNLRILKLEENGTKLSVKGEGESIDRVRCTMGAR